MNKNCIFCDIVDKKINSNIIYENETVMGILDIDPINEGHVLLITKKHYLDLDEIPEKEIAEIFNIAKKIVKALKITYPLNGYSIIQNGGDFNDIGHFHLHIFPRYHSDGFSWKYSKKDFKVSKEICDKIKFAFENI